jgi:Phosphotransferase enzyme family
MRSSVRWHIHLWSLCIHYGIRDCLVARVKSSPRSEWAAPDSGGIVLAHGDIPKGNILVDSRPGDVMGILDLEMAGFDLSAWSTEKHCLAFETSCGGLRFSSSFYGHMQCRRTRI